jgi:hypothetical protein
MLGYDFLPAEGGIVVEIYLPKKIAYQGLLYAALERGFDVRNVKEHFRRNKARIVKLLPDRLRESYDLRVGRLRQVLNGFSMYEVDGAFQHRRRHEIADERTQCLRLITRPDYDRLERRFRTANPGRLRTLANEFLRSRADAESFIAVNQDELSRRFGIDARTGGAIVEAIGNWLDDGSFFLYGYVCYHLAAASLRQPRQSREEEILVTSHYTVVNVIGYRALAGRAPAHAPASKRRRAAQRNS